MNNDLQISCKAIIWLQKTPNMTHNSWTTFYAAFMVFFLEFCSLNCYCTARTEQRLFNTFDCVFHLKYSSTQVWNDKKMSKKMTEFNYSLNSSQTCGGAHFEAFFCFPQPSEVWFELVFAAFVRSAAAQRYEYISAKSVWINECLKRGREEPGK